MLQEVNTMSDVRFFTLGQIMVNLLNTLPIKN